MTEMPQDPVHGPDPADPHEQCECAIERLEAEVESARRAQRLSFAELHALVGALVGDHAYAVSVQTWRHLGGRVETIWTVTWFPDDNPDRCERVQSATAADAYEQLRAAVRRESEQLPDPLDAIGDIPW